MIKTGHLGSRELFALLVIASTADVALYYPQSLMRFGGSAGWMIPLVSTVIWLVLWTLIQPALAGRRHGNLQSLSERRFGSWISGTLAAVIAVYLLVDSSTLTRTFAEALVTTVLPRSPISFLTIPFLLVVVYFAYTGIEGLTRVAWFLAPWMFLGLILLLVLDSNWLDLQYLFPLWGKGPREVLYSGGLFTSVFVNVLYLALLADRLRHRRDTVKIGYWSIVAVGFTYALVTLAFTLAFSNEGGVRSPFPLYQLGRLIYIGHFIQRLEAAFVFIWVSMTLIKVAAGLWVSSYLVASACKMPVNRPLVFPLAIIVYSMAFLPSSFTETVEINYRYIFKWGWLVVTLLPLAILMRSRTRLRKEGTGDDPPQAA